MRFTLVLAIFGTAFLGAVISTAQTPDAAHSPAADASASPVPTPHPARGATKAAIERYPDLAKKDSAFNLMFLEMMEDKAKSTPAFLAAPDWPLKLADEVARKLGVQPAPTPTPSPIAEATPQPTPTPRKPFESDPDNPLNRGAYDQHRNPGFYDNHGFWHFYY